MKGLLIAAYVESIRTLKDKSVNVCLNTQELSPSKAGEIFSLLNSLASVYISPSEISKRELEQVDAIEPDLPGKTPSQRVRNVLYRIWELEPDGYKDFTMYYAAKMEAHINSLKQHLDQLTT